jgi:predicted P-loop ATPase
MIVQALDNKYHPVRDYLNSLTWDGKDHLTELIEHFEDKAGYFEKWFRHWIVGAVAKVFEGFQNPMLVIDGPQAIGKSYFARWLCPPNLTRNFYAGAILPDSKDCRLPVETKGLLALGSPGARGNDPPCGLGESQGVPYHGGGKGSQALRP